ncbi:hypothetical protein [Streptomyces sp. ISL-11]|uniref:hypothetical protein n=1 Tax=Streptomyces sp. ISL-11 TaxID=2819174 RepID=UPI002036332C|nr:hypothetical protein [Streptomyces sp. ISL-11]
MASHARHARPARSSLAGRRGLMSLGLTVSAGAAVVASGAGAANALPHPPKTTLGTMSLPAATQGLDTALGASSEGAFTPMKTLRLNPLAGTGSDPFDNSVGTQVSDFRPVSTSVLTEPITKGAALQDFSVTDRLEALRGPRAEAPSPRTPAKGQAPVRAVPETGRAHAATSPGDKGSGSLKDLSVPATLKTLTAPTAPKPARLPAKESGSLKDLSVKHTVATLAAPDRR